MTSTLKVDELQNSLGGSDIKIGSLKHPDASGTNVTLASDGSATATLSSTSVVPASVGSSMVFLEKFTASSTSEKIFNLDSFTSYNNYIFKLNAIQSTSDPSNFRMVVGTSSSSFFESDSNYQAAQGHSYYNGTSSGGANDQTSTNSLYKANSLGNNTGYGASGTINLFSPTNSSIYTSAKAEIVTYNENQYTQSRNAGGYRTAGSDDAYVKFFFSAGSIASGTITLYGIKDA